ncbi:ComEC/Rec2 family competence protein [Paracoccus sp. S1E-3]|uniref:ComEC/Rec2 family competence protein n=1 Tax=Paracoccus sp. S1E-3 TaxID=2756130 RepID=UPI0015EF07BC|nr:ComEC/Rec2 family competence protein [Paracoccus sp. S1E-3]MBA4489698.1 ComEC/Rec2 family competence protein [Paracoccus sp. S1E-3]
MASGAAIDVRGAERAARRRALAARPATEGVAERAGLMPWVPVWMAAGIGLWFSLPAQPGLLANGVAAFAGICGLALWRLRLDRRMGDALRLTGLALILLALGFGLTSLRAWRVEAPVLGFRYYGPIEGRVIEIDRSARDRIRLTLDQVRLDRMAPARLPRKVRLSLPEGVTATPPPGTRVMLTGHLGPPSGPAEPGGFDFRRAAWFESLGAIGYTRDPVMIAAPPAAGGALRLHRLRMQLSAAMQDRIDGQAGAVASALMTGDRSGISEATNRMMRDSNLFHIISISGLHMGMLAGFVYAALRMLVVAGQALTGRASGLPAHKLAAIGAIAAAAAYLWLSGGGVATERAFLMVAVMLGAILADRRALSLRTVALAAALILALAPEALLTPGFQMSFAATVALIVIYPPWLRLGKHLPWYLRPLAMLVISSVAAGLATSPIAAAHFSRMAHYGVLANLLVVPVTGVLIMPMGPVAALLAPIGLDGPALWLMGLGTRWMLAVGGWIAGLNGAVTYVTQPDPRVLPLLGAGAVIAILCWRPGRPAWRNLRSSCGVGLLAMGFALWLGTGRPLVLISAQGDVAGVMTADGRSLSKPKGGSFTVGEWLEKDGDVATQPEAASRPGWQGPIKQRLFDLGDVTLLHLTGKGAAEAAQGACSAGRIIVTDQPVDMRADGCLLLDADRLRRSGAIAMHRDGPVLGLTSTRDLTGDRPWSY